MCGSAVRLYVLADPTVIAEENKEGFGNAQCLQGKSF